MKTNNKQWAAEDLSDLGKEQPLPSEPAIAIPKIRVTLITPCGKALAQTISAACWRESHGRSCTHLRFFEKESEATWKDLVASGEVGEDCDLGINELPVEIQNKLKPSKLVTTLRVPDSWVYQVTTVEA